MVEQLHYVVIHHTRVAWKRNILISLKTASADRMSVSVNMNQICKSRSCIESGMDERTLFIAFLDYYYLSSVHIQSDSLYSIRRRRRGL